MSGLVNSAVQWRGKPAATENINTYGPTSAYIGQWGFISSGTLMSNGFPENGALGILEVFAGGRFSGSQRFVSHSGSEYYRTLMAAWNGIDGPWGDWLLLGVNTRPGFFAGDLNTLVTPGYWAINSSATNGPADKGIGGICEVILRSNATQVIQRFSAIETTAAYNNRTWQRALSGTGTWSPWELLGTKALNDLGLAATAVPWTSAFDWQQADFIVGAVVNTQYQGWVGGPTITPAPSATNRCYINTAYAYAGVINVILSVSRSATSTDLYSVMISGNKGSRVFSSRQLYTSADTIPIANGGTGATTADNARKSLNFMGADLTVSDAGTPAIPTGAFFLGDGQAGGGNGKPFNYSTILQLSEGGVTHPDAPEFARNLIGVKNDDGTFTETTKNGESLDVPADSFISVRVEMPVDSIWNQRQLEAAEAMAEGEAERDTQQNVQQ